MQFRFKNVTIISYERILWWNIQLSFYCLFQKRVCHSDIEIHWLPPLWGIIINKPISPVIWGSTLNVLNGHYYFVSLKNKSILLSYFKLISHKKKLLLNMHYIITFKFCKSAVWCKSLHLIKSTIIKFYYTFMVNTKIWLV